MHSPFGRGRLLPLLLLLLLLGAAAPALAIDLSAYWEYREAGGTNRDTISDFQQRYSLGVGPGMTYQLTPAISFGAGFGYNRTDRDVGEGMTSVEELTPSAQLNLTNDIFTAGLAGTITEFRPDEGEDFTTRSWDATLASNWQRELWPNLRLNYSERSEESRNREGGMGLDSEEQRYSASLDWDLGLFAFFYDYSHSENDDLTDGSRSVSDTHLARFETTQSFWQKRINFSLSQQFQLNETDGSAPILAQFQAAVTDPVTGPDPEDVQLVSLPQLGDGDLDTQALTVGSRQRVHLGVSIGFEQQVDALFIYLDQLNALTQTEAEQLTWFLYRRDPFETAWELVPVSLAAVYETGASRFVLGLPNIADIRGSFMVVATNPAANPDFGITELEIVSSLTGETTTRQHSYLTNASLRIQLTPTLTASSTLIYERFDTDSESDAGNNETETTRRSVAGSLRWAPNSYVAPSVNFTETRDEFSGTFESEQVNRSYSLIVATYPLPTLNVTFGATRTDRFSDGFKTSTSDNYSVTTTAQIYPDLTASLNLNYVERERMQADTPSATGETFSTRFILNARLTPKLTADFTANYRDNESETFRLENDPDTGLPEFVPITNSTSSTDSTLSLLYRPSDLLSLRLTSTNYWSGTDQSDILDFSLNLALLRTRNTRLNLVYTRSQGEVTSNRYNLSGSWDISRNLSLQGQFNYRSSEGVDNWNTLLQLALRL